DARPSRPRLELCATASMLASTGPSQIAHRKDHGADHDSGSEGEQHDAVAGAKAARVEPLLECDEVRRRGGVAELLQVVDDVARKSAQLLPDLARAAPD